MKKLLFFSVFGLASGAAFAAGFGLYEASARGNAMGGGLVGSTKDASANYYNPANLTELTNVTIMAGMSFINPFCDVKVNGIPQQKMNAGWFPPPHAYLAAPITEDLVFGFGSYCEYGLGTKYDSNWLLKADTTETTLEQFTFNPNIAYKITDKWSFAVGARMSYITFENLKTPLGQDFGPYGYNYLRTRIKGDDFNCGYLLATQYKVTDEFRIGAIYRSRINHRLRGDFDVDANINPMVSAMLSQMGMHIPPSGGVDAKVALPSSATIGANYDFTQKFRGGVAVTWTEWSTINHLNFNLPAGTVRQDLNWEDAWRVGFGFEYDFTDAFSGALGYTYDLDPSHKNYGTTMLPPGDRHIVGAGLGYKFLDDWRIDVGYSFIIMESESRMIGGAKFQCDNSYSHIASATVSYSF